MMNRDEVQGSILSVDMSNKLAHHPFELWRVGQGRAGNLDHDDIAHPLGIVLQELLECTELINREYN